MCAWVVHRVSALGMKQLFIINISLTHGDHVGIITVSDRAPAGEYDDLGGTALKKCPEVRGATWPRDRPRYAERIKKRLAISNQGCGLFSRQAGRVAIAM